MKRARAGCRASLVALASCLFVICLVSSPGSGQLTAYSETRSFRDALEGRSMEEAISGPVDKDTSSYGERTSGGSANSGDTASLLPAGQENAASDYGAQSPADTAGQMMVNIPANGNLYPAAGQQRPEEAAGREQQQQSSGPELEREAGPISPDFPIDGQQQLMEQQAMMKRARQMMMTMGRAGRLTGSGEIPAPMLMEMVRAMKEGNMQKKMALMRRMTPNARSGRLQDQQQQQQQQDDSEQGTKYQSGGQAASGYGKKMQAAAYDGNEGAQQEDQQQTMLGNRGGAYEGQGEQEEMLGKLQQLSKMVSMKNMRAKYAKAEGANGGSGAYKRQPSDMAKSMMMSLANKAAYMANQKQQQQQVGAQSGGAYGAPMNGGSGYPSSNGAGQRSGEYRSSGGFGSMRALRRANQRQPEKKISPAMMNAMLNKMLGGRQSQEDDQSGQNGGYGGAPSRSMQAVAAMLMKQPAPMRANMLERMMMMTNGNNAMGYSRAGSKPMEMYKQMMMSAMQQQQSGPEQGQEMDQQQQMGAQPGYGNRASPTGRSMMNGNGYGSENKASGYGADASSSSTTPSSYSAGAGSSTAMYGGSSSQKGSDMPAGYDNQPEMGPADGQKGYGMAGGKGVQQQEQQATYGAAMNPPMMRMTPKMSYGGEQSQTERPASGKLMQQVMQMMRMKQLAMAGRKSGAGDQQQQMEMSGPRSVYPTSGEQDQPQQQEQPESRGYGGQQQTQQGGYGTKSAPPSDDSGPSSGVKGGAGSGAMSRPAMSMGMSYDQDQQQQRGEDGPQQQQEQSGEDDQYGAAPMGQAEPFAFDYKVEDDATGNNQYRKEESDRNGVVRGSYGYMDSTSGVYRHVEYVADENGFRANIKSNEPGLSDKTNGNKGEQPQQQQQQQQDESRSAGGDAGTKSGPDEAAYQPQQGPAQAPPSSSSSLGGSAAPQAGMGQMPAQMLEDGKTQQRQMQMPQMNQKMPQDQQKQMPYQDRQQAGSGELEK